MDNFCELINTDIFSIATKSDKFSHLRPRPCIIEATTNKNEKWRANRPPSLSNHEKREFGAFFDATSLSPPQKRKN
jgi:hypothetical protein